MNHAKLKQLAPTIIMALSHTRDRRYEWLATELRAALSEQPEGKVVPNEPTVEWSGRMKERYPHHSNYELQIMIRDVLAAAPINAETTQEELWNLEHRAVELLDIIAAEFQSDPMSVQCFDLRIVEEAINISKRLKDLTPAWGRK